MTAAVWRQVTALKKDIGTKELDVNLSPRGPIGPVGLCPPPVNSPRAPCRVRARWRRLRAVA